MCRVKAKYVRFHKILNEVVHLLAKIKEDGAQGGAERSA